jgi:hypothetical protein
MAVRKHGAPRVGGLRERLLEKYEARATRYSTVPAYYRLKLEPLRAGEPVVLSGWQLHGYGLPVVRTGQHGFYMVEPDGSVVEVVPRRDPRDPGSVIGYDEVRR